MPGDVVTVTSGKGGVGKTTTAVNLGVALRQRGHSVVVLDADLGMPNVAGLFDVDPERTLHDVLADEADVEEATHEIAEGIGVLTGDESLEGFAAAEPDRLEGVVAELAERYRYVLVDTGGGLTYEGVLPLEFGDEALLVTSPDPAAVGDTKKSGQLAERVDVPVQGVVVTHATDAADAEEIADDLGAPLLGVVPLERAVTESTADGTPVAAHAPDSAAAEAYDRLAAGLSDDNEAIHDQLESAARGPNEAADAEAESPDADETSETNPETASPDEAEAATADADGGDEDETPDVESDTEPAEGTTADGGAEPSPSDAPGDEEREETDDEATATDEAEEADDVDSEPTDADAAEPTDGDASEPTDDGSVDESESDSAGSSGDSGGLLAKVAGLFR